MGTMHAPLSVAAAFALFFAGPACVASSAPTVHSQSPPADTELDTLLLSLMDESAVVGMQAVVVVNGGADIAYSTSLGVRDLGATPPLLVNDDTAFMIASISKTVAATAVMQLVERGELSLDSDVNDHLPFAVRNPQFPDNTITLKSLLVHTNGIGIGLPHFLPATFPSSSLSLLFSFTQSFLPSLLTLAVILKGTTGTSSINTT
jgi:CubicO group peptidase (beta-lactamase class C family)